MSDEISITAQISLPRAFHLDEVRPMPREAAAAANGALMKAIFWIETVEHTIFLRGLRRDADASVPVCMLQFTWDRLNLTHNQESHGRSASRVLQKAA